MLPWLWFLSRPYVRCSVWKPWNIERKRNESGIGNTDSFCLEKNTKIRIKVNFPPFQMRLWLEFGLSFEAIDIRSSWYRGLTGVMSWVQRTTLLGRSSISESHRQNPNQEVYGPRPEALFNLGWQCSSCWCYQSSINGPASAADFVYLGHIGRSCSVDVRSLVSGLAKPNREIIFETPPILRFYRRLFAANCDSHIVAAVDPVLVIFGGWLLTGSNFTFRFLT